MSKLTELIIDGLTSERRYDNDPDTLADIIERYVNSKYVIKFEEFTHGRPFYYDCTFPSCIIDGHKPLPERRPQVHSAHGNEGYCYCGVYLCKEVWPEGRR